MTATRKTHPKIHMASLGCAKNLVDSEQLLARLASAGAWVGAAAEDADIVLVNTCGFIGPAIRESMETIRQYLQAEDRPPGQKLFVIGCLVQRDGPGLREKLPDVDGFFGLHEHRAITAACGLDDVETEDARLLLTPQHTAYVRVSDGCDNRCSYCTIPLIRGPLTSRPASDIVHEARQLVEGGVREITLIGQDTTSYGKDLPGAPRIHDLLARLSDIEELHWLRLLYAHPAYITDELIACYRELPRLVPYVDLPLQHTNDRILADMRRRVTREQTLRLIEKLRDAVPGMAIRTTFIIGYPGETDEEFQQLLADVNAIRFDHMGAFAYSPEEGTTAFDLPGRVPLDVVARRVDAIMVAQQEVVAERHRAMLGETLEVVIDASTEEPDLFIGRTATQAPDVDPVTLVEGEEILPGQFVRAEIVGADGYDLVAVAVAAAA